MVNGAEIKLHEAGLLDHRYSTCSDSMHRHRTHCQRKGQDIYEEEFRNINRPHGFGLHNILLHDMQKVVFKGDPTEVPPVDDFYFVQGIYSGDYSLSSRADCGPSGHDHDGRSYPNLSALCNFHLERFHDLPWHHGLLGYLHGPVLPNHPHVGQ